MGAKNNGWNLHERRVAEKGFISGNLGCTQKRLKHKKTGLYWRGALRAGTRPRLGGWQTRNTRKKEDGKTSRKKKKKGVVILVERTVTHKEGGELAKVGTFREV